MPPTSLLKETWKSKVRKVHTLLDNNDQPITAGKVYYVTGDGLKRFTDSELVPGIVLIKKVGSIRPDKYTTTDCYVDFMILETPNGKKHEVAPSQIEFH
ncbi:MAG: hypothetical protein AABX85_03680 [Nanoarchaeota archaeon]